jgi:hypothetical protein
MDSLQQENIKMSGESQRLSRTIDNLKLNANRLAEAETEKDDLRRSQQLLKSQLEAAKVFSIFMSIQILAVPKFS